MSENYGNIDDILVGGKTATQPATPESHHRDPVEVQELDSAEKEDLYGINDDPQDPQESEDDHTRELGGPGEQEESTEDDHTKSFDEYGNETENLSDSMKKRLQRQAESLKRKHDAEIAALRAQLTPIQQEQLQQEVRNFEADPQADGNWQQQLDAYIEQAVVNMQHKKQREAQAAQEREIQQEFETKLLSGMDRFSDFRETIQALPCEISNPMTIATRSLDDPAAFLYAAAKRHPQELERISKLKDPYAQVREMGKLEERMRKGKTTTQAPRPLGRAKEDAQVPVPKNKKEETIEDLIAKNDAKKLARMNQRYKR